MPKSLLYILSLVLAMALYYSCTHNDKQEVEVVEKTIVDTLHTFHTDTVVIYQPRYITKRVVDTLYINDTIYLPITQKYYGEKGLYDAWISGYKPQLDSIKVYNRTEYKYIEKTIEKEQVVNKYGLYANCGFNANSHTFTPIVGLTLITPKKTLYKVNVGVCNNSNVIYGFEIGTKLFK